jgi:hypothetical protein
MRLVIHSGCLQAQYTRGFPGSHDLNRQVYSFKETKKKVIAKPIRTQAGFAIVSKEKYAMTYCVNNISNASIHEGDHLWVQCNKRYIHHGIATGDYTVIHYLEKEGKYEDGGISETILSEFAKGYEIHVKQHPGRKFDGAEIVRRAEKRLGKNRSSRGFKNCEHFVDWCIEGKPADEQASKVVAWYHAVLQAADSRHTAAAGTH